MRYVFCVLFLIAASGCGKFDVRVQPVPDLMKSNEVCIIDDCETMDGFKVAMAEWLEEKGISNKVLPDGSPWDSCPWVLTYYGLWSWDLAIFLADARIDAYENGRHAGYVYLRVGQWDAHKFEKGSDRVKKLMGLLTGQLKKYPLPEKKKKPVTSD